jgi:PleD family two-component response regulator
MSCQQCSCPLESILHRNPTSRDDFATRMRNWIRVDDEPVIASSLAAILRMNGFSAKFFTCPLDALAAAGSESPDLVNRTSRCRVFLGLIWQFK